MHQILHQLNEVVPGLGNVMNLLSKAEAEQAEAARAGAAANTGFIASMGPLAIALLAIQAAKVYWDAYKENATAAAEAQKASLEKTIESLKEALKVQREFNDAVAGGEGSPTKKYTDKERQDEERNKAQVEQNKALLKVQEEAALATAKTEEEKVAIRKKYAAEATKQDLYGSEVGLGKKESLIADITSDINARKTYGEGIQKDFTELGVNGDPAERKALADKLAKETAAVQALQEERARLQADVDAGGSVLGIRRQTAGRVAALSAQTDGTVEAGVSAIVAGQSGKLNASQKTAIDNLKNTFVALNGNTDNLIAAVKYGHAHMLTQAQEIQLIKNQLRNLSGPGQR
jgi:colicin import membrane protein